MIATNKAALAAALVTGLASCIASTALAAETITYSYDSKGRVLKVERSGSVNAGVKTEYTYDRANNRKTVKTTGSPNAPRV